jgi:hypothetical protein
LKKKNQKTFVPGRVQLSGQIPDLRAGAELKVFCFFSSEKKALLK